MGLTRYKCARYIETKNIAVPKQNKRYNKNRRLSPVAEIHCEYRWTDLKKIRTPLVLI